MRSMIWRPGLLGRGGDDLLALDLALDRLLEPLADLVLVALGVELVGGDLLHELDREPQLRLP